MSYYLLILVFAAIFSFYLAIRDERKFQNKLNELEGFRVEMKNISAKLNELNSRSQKVSKVVFMINQEVAFSEEHRSLEQLKINDAVALKVSTEKCFAILEAAV